MADGVNLHVEMDKLFDTLPEGFTAARNALAKALKAEQRKDEAAEVTALRKPNRLVWAMNQLSLNGDDALELMFEAADDVRNDDVEDFRGAVADLRQAVNDTARVAAAYLDPPRPSDRADLAQALMAVVADEDAMELLHARRLVEVPAPDAFGLGLVAVPSASTTKPKAKAKPKATKAKVPPAATDQPPDQLAIRRATKRQKEAAKEADAANRALARAEKALAVDAEALAAADAEKAEAQAAVTEAEAALDAARKALDQAEASAAKAVDTQEQAAAGLADAQARAETAATELDEATTELEAVEG
jgi:hypothetical protein